MDGQITIWIKKCLKDTQLRKPYHHPDTTAVELCLNILGGGVDLVDHRLCRSLVNRWHWLAAPAGYSPPSAAKRNG